MLTRSSMLLVFAILAARNQASAGHLQDTVPATTTITHTDDDDQDEETDPTSTVTSKLSSLINFNFAGNKNTWTNLTPVIFYGWSVNSRPTKGKVPVLNTFQVGPYIGTTLDIKDSTSYIPALLLPGNAGLEINDFITFGDDKKFSVVVSPLNFGLKVISGFTDSTLALVQHSIQHSIGIRYKDFLSFSVKYATGWHNSTSYSESNFEKIFGQTNTTIHDWTLGLTTVLSGDIFNTKGANPSPLYLTIIYKALVHPSGALALPNTRFFAVGIATDLNLKSGSNAGQLPMKPPF